MKPNPIAQRIQSSFDQQDFMQTLGAKIEKIEEGKVIISCNFQESLTQQNGFFHAGVMTSIVDSACGYAALTQMPEGKDVLSVEFKMNLLRPAKTPKLMAIGQVIKSGRTLTVCEGWVYNEDQSKLLCKMTATMIAVER